MDGEDATLPLKNTSTAGKCGGVGRFFIRCGGVTDPQEGEDNFQPITSEMSRNGSIGYI